MAASSLQELAAIRNLATCELDKRRHLVTDVRTSKPYLGQDVKVCDKYLGQRHIKVKRSKCQRSGMNARLPLLPVTGHPMIASRRCDVTIRGVSNFLTFEPPGDGRSNLQATYGVIYLSGHQVSPLEGVTSQCDVTAHDPPYVPIYK